jgi:hypothetical protein
MGLEGAAAKQNTPKPANLAILDHVGCKVNLPRLPHVGQPKHTFVSDRQKGLTMHEASTPASSLDAILALAARIERDPRFHVRDVFAFPVTFVEVKDIANGLVVAFTSEAEYTLYLDVVLRDRIGGSRHA